MNYWGVSDKGFVRTQNQDAYQIKELAENTVLCVLCDGMGGAKSGNVASGLASLAMVDMVCASWKPSMSQNDIEKMLLDAVDTANHTVFEQSQEVSTFAGMGTTLVAALVSGNCATVVNVGDSRAYHIHQEGIELITRDHSIVQMMVDRGELSPEEAKSYPGKNLITRAVGTDATVECDVFFAQLQMGDCILLCSDGLSNMVDDQEILFEVMHGANRQESCQRLLQIALNREAPDNVTCLLLQV